MKKLVFKTAAHITKVQTLSDGTWKAELHGPKELSATDMATLFEARKLGSGWFIFSPNDDIDEADIPEESAAQVDEGKTASKRLYNVLYVRWKTLTDQSSPFEVWRSEQMEKIINHLKDGLPPRED